MRALVLAISTALLPWWAFAAPQNLAPVVALINPQTTNENQTLTVNVSATDPEGGTITLTTSTLPTNATFVDNGDGTGVLQFRPNFDQAGDFTITITATDNAEPFAQSSTEVDITVVNVNRLPIINGQASIETTVGQTVTASFAALDPDGDSVVFSGEDLPGDMSVTSTGNASAIVEFTPTAAEVGRVTVSIIADDGSQLSVIPLEVTVNALPVEEGCSVSHSGTSSTVAFWGLLLGGWLLRRRNKV
jgi:MYXO-CTERM domain-containing protein